jgi:hypothetical protein
VTEPRDPDDTQTRLIAASAINGTAVYDAAGEKLGTVHDVMPWHTLTYDDARGGYVVDIDPGILHAAPSYDPEDISAWEDPTYGRQLYDYYGRPRV